MDTKAVHKFMEEQPFTEVWEWMYENKNINLWDDGNEYFCITIELGIVKYKWNAFINLE